MKLLGAYIPATAAMGFTMEPAVYSGAPVSAASKNRASRNISSLSAKCGRVLSLVKIERTFGRVLAFVLSMVAVDRLMRRHVGLWQRCDGRRMPRFRRRYTS